MKHLEEKINKHHKSEWHSWAGVGSSFSLIIPVLSEFEGIGENILIAIGGTSVVSVFAMILKIGRVTVLATEIEEEHKENLKEEHENNIKQIQTKRNIREESEFLPDF